MASRSRVPALAPKVLPRSFYDRPTVEVARALVGKILRFETKSGTLAGRIVETEAYPGVDDPASHSFKGPTDRCRVMFGEAGHAYVYFTYGAHHCVNVVCEKVGVGGAVLIRALEPIEGVGLMQRRRKKTNPLDLCSGPGKLCQAFGIDLKQNGLDLTDSPLTILDGPKPKRLLADARIGITKNADIEWRFLDGDSLYVSRPSRAAPQLDLR